MVDVMFILMRAVLSIIILLVVVTLLLTVINPVGFTQSTLKELTSIPLKMVYDNIPCMVNCFTDLQGEEASILSQYGFTDIDGSRVLINWFPCNNKVMTLAMMINEMVKYDYDRSNGLVRDAVPSGSDYFTEATNLLHDCITEPNNNFKCTNPGLTFVNFCSADSYLRNYNYLPCGSSNTFLEFFSRGQLSFENRKAGDISNDFICDESIGESYNPPYALCIPEDDSKYSFRNCRPVWQILDDQEVKPMEDVRGKAKGRCEDFALLYYSLFRAIDVPANQMNLRLGYCDLPCPCKELVKRLDCDIGFTTDYCLVPAYLEFDSSLALDSISGCEGVLDLPDPEERDGGDLSISVLDGVTNYVWKINQNYTIGDTVINYRTLSLDGDYGDEVWTTSLGYYGTLYEACSDHDTGCKTLDSGFNPDKNCNIVRESSCRKGTARCSPVDSGCTISTDPGISFPCVIINNECIEAIDGKPYKCLTPGRECYLYVDGSVEGLVDGASCTIVSGDNCFKLTGGAGIRPCFEGETDCVTINQEPCEIISGSCESGGQQCTSLSETCVRVIGGNVFPCDPRDACAKIDSGTIRKCFDFESCRLAGEIIPVPCTGEGINCREPTSDVGLNSFHKSWSSTNLITSRSSDVVETGADIETSYSIDGFYSGFNSQGFGSSDNGLPFRTGFKIRIDSLTDCDDDYVVVGLGISDNQMNLYTIEEGSARGIVYEGEFDGTIPYFQFFNPNPSCTVDYTILGNTAGFVFKDACRNYYKENHDISELVAHCSAYFTSGSEVDTETQEIINSDFDEITTVCSE